MPSFREAIYWSNIFGRGGTDAAALEYGIPVLARLPIDPKAAELCDDGCADDLDSDALGAAVDLIERL